MYIALLMSCIFCSTDGLGFGPDEIGTALGLSSTPLIVIQVFLFPAVEKRVGVKRVCIILLSSLPNISRQYIFLGGVCQIILMNCILRFAQIIIFLSHAVSV